MGGPARGPAPSVEGGVQQGALVRREIRHVEREKIAVPLV